MTEKGTLRFLFEQLQDNAPDDLITYTNLESDLDLFCFGCETSFVADPAMLEQGLVARYPCPKCGHEKHVYIEL